MSQNAKKWNHRNDVMGGLKVERKSQIGQMKRKIEKPLWGQYPSQGFILIETSTPIDKRFFIFTYSNINW